MGFNTLSSHDSTPIMPTTSEQSEVRQAETVPAPGGVSLQYGPKGEPIAVVSPEAADEIGRREAVAKFRALMMKKLPQLAGAIETQRIDTFPIDEEIGRYIPGKYLFIMRSMDERKSPTWFDETGKMQLDFYEKMSRPAVRLFFMNPNKPMYAQEGSGYKIVLNWKPTLSEDSEEWRARIVDDLIYTIFIEQESQRSESSDALVSAKWKFDSAEARKRTEERYKWSEKLLLERAWPLDLGSELGERTGIKGFLAVPTESRNIIWFTDKGEEFLNTREVYQRETKNPASIKNFVWTKRDSVRILEQDGEFVVSVLKNMPNGIAMGDYRDPNPIFFRLLYGYMLSGPVSKLKP